MLCDYGCGQEAKYPFKNGKWCCSKHWTQCPAKRRERSIQKEKEWEDPNSGYNSISHKEKLNKAQKKLWEDPNSVFNSILYREKQSKLKKLSIEQIKEKYKFFSEVEEIRYNPDKPREKEIQVHCKNHLCPSSKEKNGWFTPTSGQIYHRANTLKNPIGFGESNFYCSQECKDTCPTYDLRFDPFYNTEKPYTQVEYSIWNSEVLERQKEEDGYNFCEICYSTKNLHVHHEKPVKTHPLLALDPDNGIVLCKDCHYEIGHKTGTECSTGALANKVLLGCKLGGQK